jgi:hypothetical protein
VTVAELADHLALALDPVELARRVGIEPDPWQADVLRSGAPRMLLNASRQSGKSTTVAILSLHTALYRPSSLCLMLSPTLRQSGELFRTAKGLLVAADAGVPLVEETQLSLRLANGSRIVSLPGQESTIRGYASVRLLAIDEASRVGDELYYAVLPMLAVSGGRLATMSTPFGKRGWWSQEWIDGGPDWLRVEVPATASPRIPTAFLAEQRRRMPARWFSQEYLCQFEEAEDAVFRFEDIAAAFTPDLEPLPC